MASISKEPNGRRTIQFVRPDGTRPSIRLGKISPRGAEGFKLRVEQLILAKDYGQPLDTETAAWLAALDDTTSDKLARVGLIDRPERKATATLGAFLDEYKAKRIDVKPATKEVWQQVVRNLKDHFGADRDVASVTEADAEDFKLYLIGEKLAPTTVHKRLQFARMFFRAACKRKGIPANPFAEVTAKAAIRQDRQRFITRDETERLLAVCNPTWRVIVGLSRLRGLRCPSEVLSLCWQDVDWAAGRIVVQSPKTEYHPGKGSRTIPLFTELRPILAEAFDRAPEGAVYVVDGDYRTAAATPSGWRNCNLRTQFERLEASGVSTLAPAVPRHAGKPRNGTGQGLPDPRRHGLAGEHATHRAQALLASNRRRL